jgi:integrase
MNDISQTPLETALEPASAGQRPIQIDETHAAWAELSPAAKAEIRDMVRQLTVVFDRMIVDSKHCIALGRLVMDYRGTWARNSTRALLADLKQMSAWFAQDRKDNTTGQPTDIYRRNFFPMAPRALVAWMDEQTNLPMSAKGKLSVASVRRRLASISTIHEGAGLPSPALHPAVKGALLRLRRSVAEAGGGRQKQAQALRSADIQTIVANLAEQGGPVVLRDRVLVLLAHDTGRRASELVSLRFEDVNHVRDAGNRLIGGTILLRVSKTDQMGEGTILPLSVSAIEAISAWADFVSTDTVPARGPILRGLISAKDPQNPEQPPVLVPRPTAISTRAVLDIIKKMAGEAGLKGSFSTHSARVGYVQDLVADGASDAQIMQAGGWTTPEMVARYGARLNAEQSVAVKRFF